MEIKKCKFCDVIIDENNAVILKCGNWRRCCRKCRSKQVMQYQKIDGDRRRKYANEYARKVGRVKQYPCLTCQRLCYKKYAKAFCSDICRFMHYVIVKPQGCWEWIGAKGRRGYGQFAIKDPRHLGKKYMIASRYSYEYHNGPIPDGMLVCHSCDNPPCVRPTHLWLGTNKDNQLDSQKKGRSKSIAICDIAKIIAEYDKGSTSYTKLGKKYNLSISSIHKILKSTNRKE